MAVVACLHTAASNVAVFDAACPPGVALRHEVRADLLAEAERAGGMSDALAYRTAHILAELAREASAVLLTFSTLGPAAGLVSGAAAPILRADAALAAAVLGAGCVVVLCAAPTTLESTCALFAGAEVRVVEGAWLLFRSGNLAAYHRCIAEAADVAFMSGARTVALAQSSMTPAATLCRAGLPLTVPGAALGRLA